MSFYVTGGSLHSDAASYVERRADHDLFQALLEGQFCYVLTARQMGKSSLMVRTAGRLRAAGVKVAAMDLTSIGGQNVTADQWYHGLLDTLGQELDLEDELEDFWRANLHLGPLHRMMKALRRVVLAKFDREDSDASRATVDAASKEDDEPGGVRLVLFSDEIDFVRSLPFHTDEFFAAIRECYNHRPLDPAYRRLTFCLLGVATPSDLIKDTGTTPFNVGRRIEINDFTPAEAAPLARGLQVGQTQEAIERSRELLSRVLYWTEGHPYLTQKMCRVAAEALRGTNASSRYAHLSAVRFIDQICAELFFAPGAPSRDDNLIFVRDRLLRDREDRAEVLELYRKVWHGRKVKDDELDPTIKLLRLSGVARVTNRCLRERNPIYQRVFNKEWIRANMPDAELRRQREAYLRGVIWTASVSALIIAVLVILSLVTMRQTFLANLAEARALRSSGQIGQRVKALHAIGKAARSGWILGNYIELRNEAIAALNLVDLRELTVLERDSGDTVGPELNASFSKYAVADQNGLIRIFDTKLRKLETELPAMGSAVRWLRFSPEDGYLAAGYGSNDREGQRFVLWRVQDRHKCLDLGEEINRSGWDMNFSSGLVAVGINENDIQLFSLKDGVSTLETVLSEGRKNVRRVASLRFDPKGGRLAYSNRAGLFVSVWEIATRKNEQHQHPDEIIDMDWNPSGEQLATACKNGDIYLLDLRTKLKDRIHRTSAQFVPPEVSFNRGGTLLATVCSDLSLRLWRPQNQLQILASFQAADLKAAVGLRFSSDDLQLAMHAGDHRVRLFSIEGGSELRTFHGEPDTGGAFQSIGFGDEGRVLFGAGPRAGICLWDTSIPRVVDRIQMRGPVSSAWFDDKGTALFATTAKGFFQMPVRKSQPADTGEFQVSPPQCVKVRVGLGDSAFATNGLAAVVHNDQDRDHIHVFHLDNPEKSSRWDSSNRLDKVAMTPDGNWLAASCAREQAILVWELGTKGPEPRLRLPGSRQFCFSPSGKWMIAAASGEFEIRKVGSWTNAIPLSRRWTGFDRFSPLAVVRRDPAGGCLMAMATSPTVIELFQFSDSDVPSITKLARLESPDQLPILQLAFDSSGSRLAAGSENQIIQVWDLARIREQLDQHQLASGFPSFPVRSKDKSRLVIQSSSRTEAERLAADLKEEWLIRVDNLSEQIESASSIERAAFSELHSARGKALKFLGDHINAQRDFEEALRLNPTDQVALEERSRMSQEPNAKIHDQTKPGQSRKQPETQH